ncbi:glycosyltransferase family 4 protein [Albibacterium indicum]|uniref:glycosyltransferase family 4 protein n=1 Tax=Albibacterium indicum TaxID=2292082 RepID=UPI000E5186DA|nr:glycosyltransferase family 4 protein [Pedobacter indicus]
MIENSNLRILVITNILPISEIERKKNENDVILETEKKFKLYYPNIEFKYIFVTPYSNIILSVFSKRWLSYYKLRRGKTYSLADHTVHIYGLLMFPIKFSFRKLFYKLSYFFNRKMIARVIKDFEPSVIHAQNVDEDVSLARYIFKEYGIPYIVTLRSIQRKDSVVKTNLVGPSSYIAISFMQKKIANSFGIDPVFIPHGIPDSFFSTIESHEKRDTRIRIISVCRLLKLKNLDMVIKALATVNYDYTYHIYGDGPEKQNLERLITRFDLSNKVTLHGFVPNRELPGILSNMDLFVMPSFPETLGRVYLEAMACGLPIIGVKNTGIDGIVENGKHGFLVDIDDERSLERVLTKVFDNPDQLREMSVNARKLVEAFRWEIIIEKLHNVYIMSRDNS